MERSYAMNESKVNELLASFLDKVETLAHRHEALREKHETLKQKAHELNDRVEELEDRNRSLQDELDNQRLEFSELAGTLENRLNRMKDEAAELLPEENQ